MLADRYGNSQPNRKVFVYAAGGYYWPGQGLEGLTREMQSYLDRGYSVVQLADGQIVTDPKKLKQGDLLRLRLAKGETQATASGQ